MVLEVTGFKSKNFLEGSWKRFSILVSHVHFISIHQKCLWENRISYVFLATRMWKVKVKVAQSCPTLRPHGLYSSWNSPGQNTGVGSYSLLQGIFPIQGLNSGLLHCRWILYNRSPQGSLRILDWVAIPSPADVPDPGIKPGSTALQAHQLSY